jgi:protein-disulfide isomerase
MMEDVFAENLPLYEPPPWYRQWWGILVMLGVILFLILVGGFLLTVRSYYVQIQEGTLDPAVFASDRFTSSAQETPASARRVVDVSADDDPSLGPRDAAVQIVAFEDYECPFSEASFSTIRELTYLYPKDVRFVYRDYPLQDIHPRALLAAQAGECADEQGNFWPMHDKIYQNPFSLTTTAFEQYAKEIGLDVSLFSACLNSGVMLDEIEKDTADAVYASVRGTPTFFVNGKRVEGDVSLDIWKQLIASELE